MTTLEPMEAPALGGKMVQKPHGDARSYRIAIQRGEGFKRQGSKTNTSGSHEEQLGIDNDPKNHFVAGGGFAIPTLKSLNRKMVLTQGHNIQDNRKGCS